MKSKSYFAIGTALLGLLSSCSAGEQGPGTDGHSSIDAQSRAGVVRIAELEIDPAQLDQYHAIVKKEMEASVRVEPGVLAIYAVAEKDDPTKITFFEMYADEAAYEAHRETAHFRKYFDATQHMIRSRRLIEAVPVQLSGKT